MRKIIRFLANSSIFALMPLVGNAAGTYYTGTTYQSPQSRYGQSASYGNNSTYMRSTGYGTNGYASVRYNNANTGTIDQRTMQSQKSQQNARKTSANVQSGFSLAGGITHENAMWNMEMKESGSILHYDNVAWNVLDLKGKYVFDMGNTMGQIEAGFKYGLQWGESTMVDDDITNGGIFVTRWIDTSNNVIGDQIGNALSVGTSEGGNLMGFHVGLGLPGAMQVGNLKITPSVGYRYLKYKLETKKNYGLSVDTAACFTVPGSDEIQCDPAVIVHFSNGTNQIIWRDDINGEGEIIGSNAEYVKTAGTYYYRQPGVSHSYEVEWSGPYLAMDMAYDINQNNVVDARIEIGLPGYSAEGDQPYRFDWQHPKSVSDSSDMFSAFHLGMGANWTTAITDNVSLSFGVTYDYYNVSGADAETYLNASYYTTIYNDLLAEWAKTYPTDTEKYMLGEMSGVAGDPTAMNIKEIEEACPGWVCKNSGEIDSFYRSLGVRVGFNARF